MALPQKKRNSEELDAVSSEMLTLRAGALWQAFRAEHFAFIAICLYLILEYLKLETSYPIFGIFPFLRFSLIFSIAGLFLDKKTSFSNSPMHWLIVGFLIHCLISAALAYNAPYAYSKYSIVLIWAIVYFLITAIVNSERRLFFFLLVYFLANFKMSQFGFFSWAGRGFGFASWGITGAGWFRNSGELGLQMSMFFAYTLCFAIYLRKYWGRWTRYLMYFLPFSALACVIASSSRGAIVGTLAVLGCLSLYSKYKIRAWSIVAVVLTVAYSAMPPEFLARFQNAGTDATSLSRMAYWAKAELMLKENPFFGVGYYNWIPYYHDFYFNPQLYWRIEEAHNTYLQLGAELGYIGLAFFLIMNIWCFRANAISAKLADRSGFEFLRAFAVGMNAAAAGMVVASIFLTAFFLPNYWIHFALTECLRRAIRQKLAASASGGNRDTSPGIHPKRKSIRVSANSPAR